MIPMMQVPESNCSDSSAPALENPNHTIHTYYCGAKVYITVICQLHFPCKHIRDWRALKADFGAQGGHGPVAPLPTPLDDFS